MEKNYIIELDKAITKEHTGKMFGLQSLSTSCLCNKYCALRQKNNSAVCAHCYAKRELERKKTLREKMQRNTELLTEHDFAPDEIPYINASVFRFESFGELASKLQVKNYFSICEKNKHCQFAIWTKNAWLIKNAMKYYSLSKPENLIIVASLESVNPVSEEAKSILKALRANGYDFIDKLFAVYTKGYAKEHAININCGSKSCIDCMKCYTPGDPDEIINEILK